MLLNAAFIGSALFAEIKTIFSKIIQHNIDISICDPLKKRTIPYLLYQYVKFLEEPIRIKKE